MSKGSGVIFTLLLNGVAPWVIYLWLSKTWGEIPSLSIATLVPLVDNVIHLMKNRKLDVFGSLMLLTLMVTLVFVMMGGSEKILLIRESIVTALVGLIFLGSLLFKRPLMYYLAMRFMKNDEFPTSWNYKYFRFVLRLMTFIWGMALTLEAAIRISLVFLLTTAQYLAVSSFILYGFIGAAVIWTLVYRRYSAEKFNRIKESFAKGLNR